MTSAIPIPTSHLDPINAKILSISEDQIQGFHRAPFHSIAELAQVSVEEVCGRIAAMLEAGSVRRVRQTLLTTSLADGALVAWKVSPEKLDSAFDFLFQDDPFSGHVVVRSTDSESAGAQYRLWTTVKVPAGISLEKHCQFLAERIGAETHRIMRAKGIFTLGVGHVRRQSIEPGDRAPQPANMRATGITPLTEEQWNVLLELKVELKPEEIAPGLWENRAAAMGLETERFFEIAEDLSAKGVVGRFSTFLEHVKPQKDGQRVTRFNGLFHWAVDPSIAEQAGSEVGRHRILTHCYWREAGPEFGNVNIMAVAHGTDKTRLLEHKAAIDQHLKECGIEVTYTNVFWGGRSEIKPSEISPLVYEEWAARHHAFATAE
ncbi:MAG: Lrp/AsnC family transcriptional regulator [Verrucomicrobiales bacterium]